MHVYLIWLARCWYSNLNFVVSEFCFRFNILNCPVDFSRVPFRYHLVKTKLRNEIIVVIRILDFKTVKVIFIVKVIAVVGVAVVAVAFKLVVVSKGVCIIGVAVVCRSCCH